MNANEFNTKFNALPALSKTIMAEIITGLYAEAGFSDLDSGDLSCTPAQWTGVSKKLIEEDLIFIETYDAMGQKNWDAIYCTAHNYENEDNGSWDEIQAMAKAHLDSQAPMSSDPRHEAMLEQVKQMINDDPDGFATALVNTIDTHAEHDVRAQYPMDADRASWALAFILAHRN